MNYPCVRGAGGRGKDEKTPEKYAPQLESASPHASPHISKHPLPGAQRYGQKDSASGGPQSSGVNTVSPSAPHCSVKNATMVSAVETDAAAESPSSGGRASGTADDADARDRIVAILRKVPARRARIPATNNHFRTLRRPGATPDAAFPVSIDP